MQSNESDQAVVAVLISSGSEWRETRLIYNHIEAVSSPLGEWFELVQNINGRLQRLLFFHGGWGKILAAASTQYVIDRWSPSLLINIGTCGGIEGEIEMHQIVAAERTVVYDIYEKMGDSHAAVMRFVTELDVNYLDSDLPHPIIRGVLVSGDRDLHVEDIASLRSLYGAIAADWESGAIAYVASRNKISCLILRGVSDIVTSEIPQSSNSHIYYDGVKQIMPQLLGALPQWIELWQNRKGQ